MCAQLVKVVVVFCMLLSPLAATPAAGAIIFSEDFSSVTSPDTEHLGDSEKWGAGTKYLFMPSDLDWIFSGDAVLVIHPTEADQAMALNETGGHGAAMTVPIPGFIPGQEYLLTFDHWGGRPPRLHVVRSGH